MHFYYISFEVDKMLMLPLVSQWPDQSWRTNTDKTGWRRAVPGGMQKCFVIRKRAINMEFFFNSLETPRISKSPELVLQGFDGPAFLLTLLPIPWAPPFLQTPFTPFHSDRSHHASWRHMSSMRTRVGHFIFRKI